MLWARLERIDDNRLTKNIYPWDKNSKSSIRETIAHFIVNFTSDVVIDQFTSNKGTSGVSYRPLYDEQWYVVRQT